MISRLWRKPLNNSDTLFGMQACLPPLSHPPIAIMLYYLYEIVEKFPVLVNAQASQCAPAPEGASGAVDL